MKRKATEAQRRTGKKGFLLCCAAGVVSVLLLAAGVRAQQVVDRIVARVEGDILTESEMREAEQFQRLVNGAHKAPSWEELLRQLLEQWIVAVEAGSSRFAHPTEAAVDGEVARLRRQIGTPEEFERRVREIGLNAAAVRRQVERQMFLSQYLDYKFRPAALVEPKQIEEYYRAELLPRLAARGEKAPALESVQEQIREVLTQREITSRAERWLEESRARLKVEIHREAKP